MNIDTVVDRVLEKLNDEIMTILTKVFNAIFSVSLLTISMFIIYYSIRFMILEENEDSQKIIFLYFLFITIRVLNALMGVKY